MESLDSVEDLPGPDIFSDPETWGLVEDHFKEAMWRIAKTAHWTDVVDTLVSNQHLSTILLRILYHVLEPERWDEHFPDSPNDAYTKKSPKMHVRKDQNSPIETKQHSSNEPNWTELKQQLSEAKETLIRIEKTFSSSKPEPKPNSQTISKKCRNLQERKFAKTEPRKPRTTKAIKSKPICNPEREVVITGVPYQPGENLGKIIEKIASDKGVEVHKGNITRSFRALNKDIKTNATTPSPKIIVEWATSQLKQAFKRHNPNRLPAGGGGQQKIYINENLTQEQQLLFFKTRQTKKRFPKDISHAWTRDGHCFVRTTKEKRKIEVTKDEDLQLLTLQFQKQNKPWLLVTPKESQSKSK